MKPGEQEYTAEGKYATEEEAKTDLDTCGYAGKWKMAQEGAAKQLADVLDEIPMTQYWDAVRLYFLELGGCWLSQKPFNSGPPVGWVDPMPRAWLTPVFEYREPTKSRFA